MPGKKLTGDLAQTSVGANITVSGSTTSASTSVTVSSTAALVVGQTVVGTGIPNGTTVASITSSTVFVLSAAATATSSGVSLAIGGPETQVIGLMDWSIDWKLKTAEATTTDDSGYESSLPSTAGWTAKAKYVYLDGDTSQSANVRATITALSRAAVRWNFFNTPATGADSYYGMAYIDGITLSAGVGKIVGMDVSLKGTGPLTIATTTAEVANASTITGEQAEN